MVSHVLTQRLSFDSTLLHGCLLILPNSMCKREIQYSMRLPEGHRLRAQERERERIQLYIRRMGVHQEFV